MNDTVNTTKGKVGITFTDNTRVEVNENSKLLIDDFVYDPKSKGAGKLAMKVALGTVRYASGAVAKENNKNVDIKTPTATVFEREFITEFLTNCDRLTFNSIKEKSIENRSKSETPDFHFKLFDYEKCY